LHANPNHDNNSHRPAYPRGNLTRPQVEEIQLAAGAVTELDVPTVPLEPVSYPIPARGQRMHFETGQR
jgi:hypothetical protein